MLKDKELRCALKLVLTAAAVVILIKVLVKLAPILTVLAVAVLIVYCMTPLVNFLTSKKIKPFWASTITTTAIIIGIVIFFYLLIPGLIAELRQLTVFASTEYYHDLLEIIHNMGERFGFQLTKSFFSYITDIIAQIPFYTQNLLNYLISFFMKLFSRIWIGFALVFIVFYLVQDIEKTKSNLTFLFPRIYQQDVTKVLGVIDQKVGAYIRGTFLKCVFVGLLTGLGLFLLGMPFSLMLGLLAGGLNIILYIGPVLAAVPALLLSLVPGTPGFFPVLIVYIIVQTLDAFVFTPVFLGKAVDLSPLTVITVILIGGQLLGVLGIILAIPVAAVLKVLITDYYLKNRLA
ncbi:MAG TPA: AI-2E family transporter [Firmicutes bacterium]|nr:AI-2E family transporter [Bacillota bacterium]